VAVPLNHGTWPRSRGSRASGAVLTEESAAALKADLAAGVSMTACAAKYGVSPATVGSIRRNQSWTHVPWPEGTPASLHEWRYVGRKANRS
jgi:uncharacterized protein YjcR